MVAGWWVCRVACAGAGALTVEGSLAVTVDPVPAGRVSGYFFCHSQEASRLSSSAMSLTYRSLWATCVTV